ncbi:hypothetical protein ACHQM5_018151 [Ranunculus cassubicifolius]
MSGRLAEEKGGILDYNKLWKTPTIRDFLPCVEPIPTLVRVSRGFQHLALLHKHSCRSPSQINRFADALQSGNLDISFKVWSGFDASL